MQEFVISIINEFGYFGIGLLMVLENILLFIPSEIILTFGGFMTTYFKMEIEGVIIAATIGSVIGAIALYVLGMFINREHLKRLLSANVARYLWIRPYYIDQAHQRFAEKGVLTVFFSRFIPIVRCLISIPAGYARMNLGIFLVLTILGTGIWNSVLIYLGAMAGKSWNLIVEYVQIYSFVILALIAVIAVIFRCLTLKKKRSKSEQAS